MLALIGLVGFMIITWVGIGIFVFVAGRQSFGEIGKLIDSISIIMMSGRCFARLQKMLSIFGS